MTDNQVTFSCKTLIFTVYVYIHIYIYVYIYVYNFLYNYFATLNTNVTSDHYNDIMSQLIVLLFCDDNDPQFLVMMYQKSLYEHRPHLQSNHNCWYDFFHYVCLAHLALTLFNKHKGTHTH